MKRNAVSQLKLAAVFETYQYTVLCDGTQKETAPGTKHTKEDPYFCFNIYNDSATLSYFTSYSVTGLTVKSSAKLSTQHANAEFSLSI
jgi:hypothetical protein